jgi:uncharacterized protein YybS (DUF2232 family)
MEIRVFKKHISAILLFSLIALGSSGLLMIFFNSLEIRIRLHPVHEIFGMIMCVSGCFHIYFNFKPVKSYMKEKQILISGILLTVLLIFLYGVGLNKPIDAEFIKKIEGVISQIEH